MSGVHRRGGGPVTRRAALLGLASLGATACGVAVAPAPPATPTPPLPTTTPPPMTTPAPAPAALGPAGRLDDVPRYTLLPGEVEPACKAAAVEFVTAALTSGTPASDGVPLARRLAAVGQPVGPTERLRELVPAQGASTVEVVYPQYGGLTTPRRTASVMLVAEQRVVTAGSGPLPLRRTLTLDVRLTTDGRTGWTVVDVLPAQPPATAPALSAAVQQLLDTERVVLPDAARADLLGGGVHDVVVRSLLALAEDWRVHVLVLAGGHPDTVWATDRVSNHTLGKAVDIWALDGIPVIDRERCPWPDLVRAASAAGASEIGGPRRIGVAGGFTDEVHQDHVHLGFAATA